MRLILWCDSILYGCVISIGGVALGVAGEPAYRAFISYSHHDLATAKRLHRRLERYRMPKRLVGGETARGPVPARLTPIFRDIDELPAADDLSAEIKAALAASGALIVICSPHAKASRWVNREIETFRELYGDARPVLAALVEGEPGDAFPEALTLPGREPIAADFRKGEDGAALAELKLIAGLTGASLDTLVQRDAQARLRRVTAITGIAAIAVLAMAGLTWTAITARNEAQRQRAEAEGLVEYMLTDLRDKLKGVGRLDVMTAVNERAMGYYGGQQALEGLTPGGLDRRARILHAMGEDDEKRGDRTKALQKFVEAERTTAAVLQLKPNDPEAVFAHAQSAYWVGYIHYLEYRENEAKPHWQAYANLARQLRRLQPDTIRSFQETAYAEGNLCSLALAKPVDKAQALRTCKASLDGMEAVDRRSKGDQQVKSDLANRQGWYADSLEANGRTSDSLLLRHQQAKLLESLIDADPKNADFRYRRAVLSIALIPLFQKSGKSDAANAELLHGRKLLVGLVHQDAENSEYRKRILEIEKLNERN